MMSDDLCQVKQLLLALQRCNSCRPEPLTRQCSAVPDERPPSLPSDRKQPDPAIPSTEQAGEETSRQHLTLDRSKPPLIIGDSNVRRLQASSYLSTNVRFHSIPGATANCVTRDLDRTVSECGASQVVIHAGANDIARKGSEIVANTILDLAERARNQKGVRHVFICSVTPRKDLGSFIFSRAESVNNRLRSLCLKAANITFIDLRQTLDGCSFNGLSKDAIH